jgi:diguanylate cyclase (GGDEF)-like protein
MIDLDGFKAVNDEYGHQVGDELLQLAAGTVASQLRTADVAARFGGDEFVALLPQSDAESARVLAERILEKFAQEMAVRHPNIQTTMSIGIASLTSLQENTPQALVRKADSLLYLAKKGGRNQIAMPEESANPTTI